MSVVNKPVFSWSIENDIVWTETYIERERIFIKDRIAIFEEHKSRLRKLYKQRSWWRRAIAYYKSI